MKCLHCLKRDQIKGKMLCEVCILLPKCEGCQVILGGGHSKSSKTNPKRCESCLYLEEKIKLKCIMCKKKIPIFYSPNTETLHFLVRGNFCGHCNNICAREAREVMAREETKEYTGYLALMADQLAKGKITIGMFEEARELNPHDINRIISLIN